MESSPREHRWKAIRPLAALAEIPNLLKLEDGRRCRETERLAQQRLDLVEARIADLMRLRKNLREMIGRCESGRGRIACPIIKSLVAEP